MAATTAPLGASSGLDLAEFPPALGSRAVSAEVAVAVVGSADLVAGQHAGAPVSAAAVEIGRPRRLHPWSWLFVLLTQLRNIILPLLVLVVFGRGEWWEILSVLAAVGLGLHAFLYSLSFRYWLRAGELVLREGLFDRTERHVPYARIQNVAQRRNLLHRLFGVTELRLESAGGAKPEAVMNVVTLTAAVEIEAMLRSLGEPAAESAGEPSARAAEGQPTPLPAGPPATGAAASGARPGAAAASVTLFTLPLAEQARFGLISNRGIVLVGAVFAFLAQADVDFRRLPGLKVVWNSLGAVAGRWIDGHGPIEIAFAGALALLGALLLLRLFSVALALSTYHGFRLERAGDRLVSEHGLFTRVRAGAASEKIQRVELVETVLHRALGRVGVEVSVAAGTGGGEQEETVRLRWLAPIARPAEVGPLLAAAQPGVDLDRLAWHRLHPRAARRYAKEHYVVLGLTMLGGSFVVGTWSLLGLALVPLVVVTARGFVRTSGYGLDAETFAVRLGWVRRQTTVLRLAKVQAVRLVESPFDRRAGMASLRIDLAGGGGRGGGAVEVPYLGRPEAERLFWVLARAAAAGGRLPNGRRTLELPPTAAVASDASVAAAAG